jgi:hypothetical protein
MDLKRRAGADAPKPDLVADRQQTLGPFPDVPVELYGIAVDAFRRVRDAAGPAGRGVDLSEVGKWIAAICAQQAIPCGPTAIKWAIDVVLAAERTSNEGSQKKRRTP